MRSGYSAYDSKRSYSTLIDDSYQLPLSDPNSWYYPAYGYDSDQEEAPIDPRVGNWGRKDTKGARWARRGKITSWGPNKEEWEADDRARKRLKSLIPRDDRSPSPPTLPHLSDAPSHSKDARYFLPTTQHLSYSSFVMDKAVTHTFRSSLLDELEGCTNGLIEGEANMRRALGRLWKVISEDPEPRTDRVEDNTQTVETIVPKREDDEEVAGEPDDRAKRLARAPDLTPAIQKLFMFSYTNGVSMDFEPSHFASPEKQAENLERAVALLRELQDDGREYVERLREIRESLGDVKAQRNTVWDMVRHRAIDELRQEAIAIS